MIDLNEYDKALQPYGLTMDEFVKIRKSKAFEELEAEMSRVSPRYLEIPPTLRETALVAVLAGKSNNLKNIYDTYYTRQIPSFEEFISSKYLPKTGKTLFQTWRTELTKFFDPNKAYFEAIFTGAIGTGKSTAAMVAQVYNLLRVTSLTNPQMAMGVAPTTQMTLLLMSILKGKAYQVLLAPLITLMDECPAFQQVPKEKMLDECFKDTKGAITPFWVGHDAIKMPNNVFVQVGSQMQHAIGAGLIGASMDEAEFRRGATASSTYELYYQLKERVRSRFIGLRYICLTLMSSVQSETGMITQYAKSIPADSPHTVIYDYPIWTVRFPNAIKEDGYFYAMRGNISHPSKVLSPEECVQMDEGKFSVPPGCKVIQVPKRYQQEFNTNVSVALKNLAGMTSVGDEKPFSDTSNIESDKLPNELTFDVDLEKPNEPPFDIGKVLEQAGVFVRNGLEWEKCRYPDTKCYMHLDLAQTGIAGLSMCHKELGDNGKIIYVFDFILRVTTKNTISFEAIRRFISNLKNKYNCRIHTLSCDQYQSTMFRQYCLSNHIADNVILLSVDRSAEAYYQMANAVQAGQVKAGKCPYLREQLDIIRINNNKPYAENGVRKDVSDSCTGSVYNAICNGSDIPTVMYNELTQNQIYDMIKEELIRKKFKPL